jgi:subtilase family serine protease
VAVTEAADNPNLETDLGTYRAQYGLSACTTANGCFRKVNGSGQQGNYPPGDTGWGGEASLDVDMVSAICPNCHIVVVESTDLVGAQNVAVSLGARYISNSWGTGANLGDSAFNHAGVVDVASSGDQGFGVSYPAGEQSVVAAGGTSLNRAGGTSRGWSETAWSGAGSGCASGEPKPSWQHDTGCSSRTIADVSAVADPGTGVAFYDTYGQGGWGVVGGTSVSSPIIASVYALAANPPNAASTLYANPGALHDITSGSNGGCSPAYLCTAGSGYDGPTGLGTPNGTAAFGGSGTGGGTGPIVSGVSASLCVDDNGASTTQGSHVQIWSCNGTSAQNWTVASNGTLQVLSGCMDVTSSGTTPGTLVQYWPCNGTGAQQWQAGANGSLVNPQSGLCLDDPGFSTTQGTQLEIWTCNGGSNQRWTLP